MAWTIDYTATAEKQLRKLDPPIARPIVDYMSERIAPLDDVWIQGKALSGAMGGYWRYRIGDYRVICSVRDASLVVLVIGIGNRRDVYRN